jgi:hypothetical protein
MGGSGAAMPDVERAFSYAKDVLRQGMQPAAVEEVLRSQGFDAASASAIVQRANQMKNERRTAGMRGMIIGGVVCAIGTVITIASYTAAEEGGGGHYVIAWGAIIFGAIRFFRGLIQMSDK